MTKYYKVNEQNHYIQTIVAEECPDNCVDVELNEVWAEGKFVKLEAGEWIETTEEDYISSLSPSVDSLPKPEANVDLGTSLIEILLEGRQATAEEVDELTTMLQAKMGNQ